MYGYSIINDTEFDLANLGPRFPPAKRIWVLPLTLTWQVLHIWLGYFVTYMLYVAGYMKCPGVTVTFLPLNCIPDLSKKSKYNKLFDVIYFSNR